MQLNKINRVKIHAEVEKSIRKFISDNNLQSGDTLPSERNLVEQLGVGRSTLRESLRAMEALGVIEVVAGKGIFVAQTNKLTTVMDELSKLLESKVSVLEILQIRKQLDFLAAELAAKHATADQIKELEQPLLKMEIKMKTGEDGGEDDLEFHRKLWEASGNSILPKMCNFVFSMFLENLDTIGTIIDQQGVYSQTTSYHRPIFEAICDHNPKAAKTAVLVMYDQTEKIVVDFSNCVAKT